MDPHNSQILVNLLRMTGSPYEVSDSCSAKLLMRDMVLQILFIFSEINGYGKFIVDNCQLEIMEMLSENLCKAKQWCANEASKKS